MALSHKQVYTFLYGAWHESKSIKTDWKDMYGEEDPQAALDDMYELISNIQDVILAYTYEQTEMEKMLRNSMRVIHTQG